MTFESLRHQVSHFVHQASAPLTFAKLREICDMAADDKQLANTIFQMCKYRELVRHPAPTAAGMGVRHAYGPGKNKPGAEPQERAAGGGTPKARRAAPKARRAKGKHKKRSHKVRKVQRRNATSPRARRRPPFAPQWALRADGALLLLGTDLIIPAGAARGFVEFVRATTPAQIQALADFITTLDKGQA